MLRMQIAGKEDGRGRSKTIPFEMFSYSFLAYILGQISNPQMPCLSNHLGPNTSLGIVVCRRAQHSRTISHRIHHVRTPSRYVDVTNRTFHITNTDILALHVARTTTLVPFYGQTRLHCTPEPLCRAGGRLGQSGRSDSTRLSLRPPSSDRGS